VIHGLCCGLNIYFCGSFSEAFSIYIDYITPLVNKWIMGRGDVGTGFWWGDLREGDCLGEIILCRRTVLKSIL
jgi:hypothetical protein